MRSSAKTTQHTTNAITTAAPPQKSVRRAPSRSAQETRPPQTGAVSPIKAAESKRPLKTTARPPAKTDPVPAKAAAVPKASAATAKPAEKASAATAAKPAEKTPATKAPVKANRTKMATPATKTSPPASVRPRRAAEPRERAVVPSVVVLGSGQIWKMAGNNAVAYVRSAADACAILRAQPGQLAKKAMAVYRDRHGKAIAWQVRFESARWAEVEGMLK